MSVRGAGVSQDDRSQTPTTGGMCDSETSRGRNTGQHPRPGHPGLRPTGRSSPPGTRCGSSRVPPSELSWPPRGPGVTNQTSFPSDATGASCPGCPRLPFLSLTQTLGTNPRDSVSPTGRSLQTCHGPEACVRGCVSHLQTRVDLNGAGAAAPGERTALRGQSPNLRA